MNYRHIDYYELEGKMADGTTFTIKNISEIPTSCVDTSAEKNQEYQTCLSNLKEPTFVDPSTQTAGTVRQDYQGWNWTKGENGMWTSPSAPGTSWGDVMWTQKDKEMYDYNEAKKQCGEILNNEDIESYSLRCELRFNLDNANFDSSPEKHGFWAKIGCFFKGIFGKGC